MSYTNLRVHFIWSTKEREKLIHESYREDLYAYIGRILRKRQHVLLAIGGVEDHVHMLAGLHQSQSIAEVVRDVKSNSSRWIHENQPKLSGFQWQKKYGAFSVSESSLEEVKSYIARQKEHHRHVSFQEEFQSFLKKHGIEFDDRFVFE